MQLHFYKEHFYAINFFFFFFTKFQYNIIEGLYGKELSID